MIQLPNNCRCSQLSVFPKNWKNAKKADLNLTWRVQYYFYDPAFQNKYQTKGKFVRIKAGINRFKTVKERQQAVKALLEDELNALKQGYNPITKQYQVKDDALYEIHPDTYFIDALRACLNRLDLAHQTRKDIRCHINKYEIACEKLRYTRITISEIKIRHIKAILNYLNLSNNSYNVYRKYLSIIFKELRELEAIEYNFIRDISKKSVVKKVRKILTKEERKMIDEHLKEKAIRLKKPSIEIFRNFIRLFFHSGARETELLNLKVKDVDLKNQTFRVVINKGKQKYEVEKVIKNIALPLWEKQLKGAKKDDYVFSHGLVAGSKKATRSMITLRWRRNVKNDLGIETDFYALKHSNLDEISAELSLEDAAKAASHKSTKMVKKHYAVNEQKRRNERLKSISNTFI